jgi:hypothetical protein
LVVNELTLVPELTDIWNVFSEDETLNGMRTQFPVLEKTWKVSNQEIGWSNNKQNYFHNYLENHAFRMAKTEENLLFR